MSTEIGVDTVAGDDMWREASARTAPESIVTRLAASTKSRPGLTALVVYCAIAFLYFGLRLLIEPGSRYIGPADDPQIFIWSFAWWPHAILHGQNPFVTHGVWAPSGLDLAWTTSVPALALLFSPLTLIFGPVVSYNVAAILMPALAAWTAFLLCRHVTRAIWPALVGGYLFGFSSYLLGHEAAGHLHMTAVFLVPLAALLMLRYIEGSLTAKELAARLGPLLAVELLISTEVTFTLTLVVSGAIVLGLLLVPERRARLVTLIGPLAGAYAVAAVLTAPFFYYLLSDFHSEAFVPPQMFVADLLNFVAPTQLLVTARHWTNGVRFGGNIGENGAFLGWPALAVVALFARRSWRTPGGRFLLASLALVALAALGPELTVNDHGVLPLPWRAVLHLKLFDNVLPVRFSLYVSLAVALIVALWTASRSPGSTIRWLVPVLAILVLVPDPTVGLATRYTIPKFFTDRAYRDCLDPHGNVLPMPISIGGESDLWQVASGFRLRLAGGRLTAQPPPAFMDPPAIASVAHDLEPTPDVVRRLDAFIRAKDVTSIILDERDRDLWGPALDRIATGEEVGGIVLYRLTKTPTTCPNG